MSDGPTRPRRRSLAPSRRIRSTLHDLTQDRIRDLIEAAGAVARQIELSSLLERAVTTAMELTGARYGALGVLGDEELSDFVYVGLDDDEAEKIGHQPRGEGVLGTITREAATIRLNDISAHPDSVGFPDNHPQMKTFLGLPVHVGDRVFGNLYLTDKEGGFTEQDEVLVDLLAVAAGTAISTLRMQEQLRRVALQADRERIALDLHDSIIQDLFAVGLSLQACSGQVESAPDVVRARLGEAVDRLDATILALRRYIFDLHPPVWVKRGIGASLEDLLDSLSEPYEQAIELDVDPSVDTLTSGIAEHVTAVVKEAASNALRHAGATRISVRLTQSRGQTKLTIEDNGIGFEPDGDHGGMGLGNIARRVQAGRGTFKVTSAPGEGTRIEVNFPEA